MGFPPFSDDSEGRLHSLLSPLDYPPARTGGAVYGGRSPFILSLTASAGFANSFYIPRYRCQVLFSVRTSQKVPPALPPQGAVSCTVPHQIHFSCRHRQGTCNSCGWLINPLPHCQVMNSKFQFSIVFICIFCII